MIRQRAATDLKQAWWSLGLRGTAALVSGLILVLWLSRDTDLLFGVFGAYMLADGLIELWLAAGQGRRRERWWQTAISGGLGVLFGLSNMLGRGLSPGDRVYMISARMAAGSVSGIMTIRALQLDRLTERLLLAGGSGGICLAVLLMVMRFEIRVAPLVRLIGGFTLLLGLLLWLAALRLRGLGGSTLAAAPR